MDVPRIRYELLTRQVGHSAPIANAGPPQIGVPPGTVTLNGSGSYSPDHDALSYSWTQVSGPSIAISGANSAIATFTAAGSTSYGFSLTVTDQLTGLTGSANTTVTTQRALSVVRFSATPSNIASGQSSTLAWNVPNATSVNISGVGSGLNPAGTATVSPTTTTTYNLTATGQGGQTITASVTVTVGASNPKIIRFAASPAHISQGQSTLLSWTTTGASTVSISNSVGSVAANGSVSVSPTTTTTYTLTATGADGKTSVTAAATVTVGGGAVPSIISFTVSPPVIAAGGQASLCWNVSNSTSVSVAPGIGNEPATGCTTVTPSATTTYVLTATNAVGPNQAVVTVSVGPVQILSFSASSSAACTPICEPGFSPYPGAPVVLQWTTSNATSVIITGTGAPSGNQPTNGSVTVNPGTDTDIHVDGLWSRRASFKRRQCAREITAAVRGTSRAVNHRPAFFMGAVAHGVIASGARFSGAAPADAGETAARPAWGHVESASPRRAGNHARSRLFRRLSRLESRLRPGLAALQIRFSARG